MPTGSLRTGQLWLLLLLITGLSLLPLPLTNGERVDKILHLVAYLALFISLDLAYRPRQGLVGKLLALLFFSFLLEVAQRFIAQRQFSLADLAANLTGLLLGLALAGPVGRFLAARGWLS